MFEVMAENPGILESVAAKITAKLDIKGKNPIPRFNQAIELLNELNYLANWSAHPDGPRVKFRHCPYKDLALTNPEICQMDQKLLSILFDLPLILNKRRDFGKDPYSPCLFQIDQT